MFVEVTSMRVHLRIALYRAEKVEARLVEACRLIAALVENDPNDDAADGVTVYAVWRREAIAFARDKTGPDASS